MEAAWKPSVEDIAAYSGKYFSEELETYYSIVLNDSNNLVLRHRRIEDNLLKEAKPDMFNGSMPISVINFVRDNQGQVTGFKASNGRTTDVWFAKMK